MPARAATSGPPRSGSPASRTEPVRRTVPEIARSVVVLPGAVGPEDGDYLALVDVERDPVECLHRAVPRLDLLQLEQGGHGTTSSPDAPR